MSFRFLTRLNWILWSVLVVVLVGVMLGLANWQWQRLHERRELNELVEARMAIPVTPLDEVLAEGGIGPGDHALGEEALESVELRHVATVGTYRTDREVLVANRNLDGLAGWWVVTPLQLADGSAVAVNRGWVPMSVDPNGSWADFAPPSGQVEVTGILQLSQTRRAGPMDDPRTMPRLNVEVLDERVEEAELVPVWFQLLDQRPAQAGGEPVMLPLPPVGDGPHLNYAGQWLIFATLTVIVYGVLVLRTARRGEASGRVTTDDDPDRSEVARDRALDG